MPPLHAFLHFPGILNEVVRNATSNEDADQKTIDRYTLDVVGSMAQQ